MTDSMPSVGVWPGLAAFLSRHRKAVAIGGAIWFWTGIAIYARFLQVPEWLASWGGYYFWASVAANAIWWSIIDPKLRIALPDEADRDDRDGDGAADS